LLYKRIGIFKRLVILAAFVILAKAGIEFIVILAEARIVLTIGIYDDASLRWHDIEKACRIFFFRPSMNHLKPKVFNMSEKIAIIFTLEYYTVLSLASLALVLSLILKRWLHIWTFVLFMVLLSVFIWFYQVQHQQKIIEIEWIKV